MKNNDIFYRPPWTCGKYNAEEHVAIMFNLLSRMNYFFEEESADVIGMVLAAGRNGKVSIDDVSDKCNIVSDSIAPFFDDLCSCGLLSDEEITEEIIDYYRSANKGAETPPAIGEKDEKWTKNNEESACQAYADAVKNHATVFEVMFELTYRCSEQCIHCYNPGATRNDEERNMRGNVQELSLDDYKRIIDDFIANGLVAATISGGDPFSHPFAWHIIDYLYQHDIAVSIYTNGIGLEGKEQRLADYYPYLVQSSIYSDDSAVHDKITRIKDSWQRTVGVMDRLYELGVPIDIACPIMQTNLKTYHGVKYYMKKYGSQRSFDVMLTDSIDGDKCVSRHLRLTPEQLSVVLLDKDVIQHVDADKTYEGSLFDKDTLNGQPCGVAKNSFCITPRGDVIPCCTFHKVIGNITHQSIKKVVDESAFIKQWRQTSASDYRECSSHEYCDYCYFCPGNNFNEKGEYLNGSENNCYLAKVRYDTVMRLRAGEDILHGKTIEDRIRELSVAEDVLQREFK